MRPFDYTRADNAEAAGTLAAVGATIIAGGTNLLDLMKLQVKTPDRLVDISRLPLDRIEATENGGLRIGALVTNSACAADRRVREDYGVLARAILAGASGQLRNKATTGGNLCQHTRCPYFYDTSEDCNKRAPGTGCAAQGGINRIHAILGTSEACIASYPGDMAVAMTALEAGIVIRSTDGETRTVPISKFYRLPGDTPERDNILGPGDVILAVELPPPPAGKQGYRKVRERASYAFALVSVAWAIAQDSTGRIERARLAFGGIGAVPWRDQTVEEALVGQLPTPEVIDAAADRLLADARGQGHNDFKINLTRRTLHAVLAEACDKEGRA